MKFGRLRFVLILALLASNLCVGVFSLFYLRSLEERYAELFDRSVPLINNLRTLTRELGSVQRMARRISDPQNETGWAELLPQMASDSDKARQHVVEISAMDLIRSSGNIAGMLRTSEDYDRKVREFLALASAQKIAQANEYNIAVLRPAYDELMDSLDAVANSAEKEGNDLRARYAEESRWFGGFLLAFAGWPLLAAAVLIIVMGVLVVGLLAAVFFPRLFTSKSAPV